MECLFCQIINKTIPARIVYEDEQHLAFLDISPVTKGHTLVITKKHANNFSSLTEIEASELTKVVHRVATKLVSSLGAQGFNLGLNNGQVAHQLIDHVHFHVIPRYHHNELTHWDRNEEEAKLLDETFKKIK